MKRLAFIFLTVCFSISSYATNPNCEIYVNNRMPGVNLFIRFYPVGALFHKEIMASEEYPRYTIRSQEFVPGDLFMTGCNRRFEHEDSNKIKYNVGLDGYALKNRGNISGFFQLASDTTEATDYSKWLLLGNDGGANRDLDGLFGYGKYMLEIWIENSIEIAPEIVIPIDWLDFNYPYRNEDSGAKDLKIRIYGLDSLDITFQWAGMYPSDGDEIPLFGPGSPPYNGCIQVYKQYHRYINGNWEGYNLNGEHPPQEVTPFQINTFLHIPLTEGIYQHRTLFPAMTVLEFSKVI